MSPDPAAAPASGLTLQTRAWEDALIVHCSGRLTLEHSSALKDHVRSLIPTTRGVILDLKDVTRMDSAGLGALVAIYISAKKAKCEIALINYYQSIKDLLGLTNLLTVFESCAQSGMRLP